MKAWLVEKVKHYQWRSYQQYFDAYNEKATQVNPEIIKVYFKARNDFEAFMNTQKDDKCLDYQSAGKITDNELATTIQKKYQVSPGQKLSKDQRDQLIQELYKAEKTSIRQLARVLGVSKGMVERTL